MPSPIDLAGNVFGKLTCISHVSGKGKRRWKCQCECGNFVDVITDKLTSGRAVSCGCEAVNRGKNLGAARFKHGFGHGNGSGAYRTWLSMRYRCSESYHSAKNYSGRGIKIDPRWDDFLVFLADMGERPDGMTLDRIDVNGDYTPSNCRWATAKEQQRNRRNTNYLTFPDGKIRKAMDVADELGVKKAAMSYFLNVSRKMKEVYGCVPDS